MQIKIKSWDECPINTYYQIADLFDEPIPEVERNVALLAILCDCSEDEIWALPLPEVSALISQVNWIGHFDFNQKKEIKKINIGQFKCKVQNDLFNFSVAQYIDFQTYWKSRDRKLAEVISVFTVPEGCKYNSGYDLLELQKAIGNNISITTANSLCFFFLRSLVNLTRGLQIYLELETAKMKATPKAQEKIQELRKKAKDMETVIFGLLS